LVFDLPRNVLVPVQEVDVRLVPGPHPVEIVHADAIEDVWKLESAANPALFDGRMILPSALRLRGGVLSGQCHEIRFATLLFWRRHKPAAAEHAFANAALVSSDGALVAIRMGPRTLNPGRVHFAAGSFEVQDFAGGRVDIGRNMRREVMEETGLDLAQTRRETGYHLFSQAGATVLFQCYHLADTAEAVADRIAAFVAGETEPEIEGPVIIRSADDTPRGLMPHMRPIIDWHFSRDAA
jgi:8-oxo-dGTP pyrophosphatase MutT (NUDIX family)